MAKIYKISDFKIEDAVEVLITNDPVIIDSEDLNFREALIYLRTMGLVDMVRHSVDGVTLTYNATFTLIHPLTKGSDQIISTTLHKGKFLYTAYRNPDTLI